MDEVVFRASETIDNLQYQLSLAATESKNAIKDTSGKVSDFVVQAFSNPRYSGIRDGIARYYTILLIYAGELQDFVTENYHPNILLQKISEALHGNVTRREVLIGISGLAFGAILGYCVSQSFSNRETVYRCMQAVQCMRYSGIDAATFVEDARGPRTCKTNEVLINVKACSVSCVDHEICNGYGSLVRRLLLKYFKYCKGELPVTLGRDCTGIVVDIGKEVTRFEVGDEVWATSPFWAPGTMAQYILLPEYHVSKKPRRLGFESGSSIPFAGGLALTAFDKVGLSPINAHGCKVFIHGGCTAVGCIAVQLLIYWGAKLTVSCAHRAIPVAKALGIQDIIAAIPMSGDEANVHLLSKSGLRKELSQREKFDVIILTTPCNLEPNELMGFIKKDGKIVNTLPPSIPSDSYGFWERSVFSLFVKLKSFIQESFLDGLKEYGEPHICSKTLDKLARHVENGDIQTVVDKVFLPHDIDQALHHMKSVESIGSTVISFR